MAEVGVSPENTIMVGDSVLDIQMATNAGVESIAVSFGAESAESLLSEGPLCCCEDWGAIMKAIKPDAAVLNKDPAASKDSI
eukprot:CAMPEP_0177604658 /NCGR_PEP_ID=MMETSP0419_2-20121207/16247_1 /TAXON_ID=582737 /ORGANISM="Tetraselmis sp., Strain GSL018" /LENGTH=81 /DNA_ID=CAMNT_0019098679 /DNA_START=860 /DNA_END=1106 /DNA_ORIENTATION=-